MRDLTRFAALVSLFFGSVAQAAETDSTGTPADSATDARSYAAAEPVTDSDAYGAAIRPTPARSPEEEKSGFHLPPGFQIERFASEPQIAKPLNMAFDARGRLFVSETVEYPYPASNPDAARDRIKILEDTDGDHVADRITTFADRLNIPMGLLPYGDGVIAFSIPNLLYLRDADGDGVCDTREVLIGPFDTTRDTHGMVNALRRGFDGWIYACHGFNNQSKISARDGWVVEMTSGNTFRFRPDGTRVEHFTHGQVNPFGMTCDDYGNWFTADCHSKPITQLIRDGFYSSFGRPHDGLGFVPSMMEHLHDSTAISGLVLYQAESFPQPFRDCFFSGNVMTSRINRNSLRRLGATFKAIEEPDFLTSDDPWFRPVDLQIGPDGGLYVADFYNKIIGHYEVPLDHPDRDRTSGRIWRISLVNQVDATAARTPEPVPAPDLRLIEQLGSANLPARLRALNSLADGEAGADLIESLPATPETDWLNFRRGTLTELQLIRACDDSDPRRRTHAALIAGEWPDWSSELDAVITKLLKDSDARVIRAAAEALGRRSRASGVGALLDALRTVDEADVILRQSIRIAVRNRLEDASVATVFDPTSFWDSDSASDLASILMGLKTAESGRWLSSYLATRTNFDAQDRSYAEHVIKTLSGDELNGFVSQLRAGVDGDLDAAREILLLIAMSGDTKPIAAVQWANDWSGTFWSEQIVPAMDESDRRSWYRSDELAHWPTQLRKGPDGMETEVRSSFPLGERYVGTLRSEAFEAPGELSFHLVGHDGDPRSQPNGVNHVRLVRQRDGAVLKQTSPPRSDQAILVTWDLSECAGERVWVEVVDGDDRRAYAWLAIGNFSDRRLAREPVAGPLGSWLGVVQAFPLKEQATRLRQWLERPLGLSRMLRLELLRSLATLEDHSTSKVLAGVTRFLDSPQSAVELLERSMALSDGVLGAEWLRDAARGMDRQRQQAIARELAKSREGLGWLVTAAGEGWIAGDVLAQKEVTTSLETLADATTRKTAEVVLASIPSEDTTLDALAKSTLESFLESHGNVAVGGEVFKQHCAACHQIAGAGSLVGPQLDAVGGRGVERLVEDIVQPDRNVDRAFRTTTYLLDDGTIRVGLVRDENETTMTLIQNDGKTLEIAKSSIEEERPSVRSLMPAGLAEAMGPERMRDLLAYLLTQRAGLSREHSP